MYKYTLIIIIVVMIIILAIILLYKYRAEPMVNISQADREVKWKRDPTCKYKMLSTLTEGLAKNGILETSADDWMIYVPCTYNNISKEIENIRPTLKDQRVFIVNNADELSAKNSLWLNLLKTYGRKKAATLTPETWVLSSKEEMEDFKKSYNPNNIYILKKNIQRQEGIKITKDLNEILNGTYDSYVVVQKLLDDPYLVNGRKINMRFYLLLICHNNEISAYVHNNGFMYYTKAPFVKNNVEFGPNITTGYIERWVYDVNPLTHEDFRNHLDNKNREMTPVEKEIKERISEVVFNRIYQLIAKCVYAMKDKVCIGSKLKDYISFQMFGVDIAINDKLIPQIIEVNKGPSLEPFDERDGKVKRAVVNDVLKTLKVVKDEDNGYIKIYG